MSNELARLDDQGVATTEPFAQAPLAVQMDYARTVSTANLLPQAYRNKPADIMLAVGLGSAMGLSPAESLYRIDVIQGKPTASAELIAANVRKAGHKLRVKIDETNVSVTATIIRADDPDDPHPPTITRDRKWAQDMGLAGKENYKKQPLTMLQWRAITAVARLACPEALYGVTYSSDEMYDMPGAASAQQATGLGAALERTATPGEPLPEVDPSTYAPDSQPLPPSDQMLDTSSALAKRMFALFGEIGVTDKDNRLAYVSDVVGREVATSKDMTEDDARAVIAAIEADMDQPFPEATQ